MYHVRGVDGWRCIYIWPHCVNADTEIAKALLILRSQDDLTHIIHGFTHKYRSWVVIHIYHLVVLSRSCEQGSPL